MTSNEGCGNKIGPYDCCTIVTGDARLLAKAIPNESVDLIFTDPVYDRIEDYRWLAETADRILTTKGALLCFCGIGYQEDVQAALRAGGRPVHWILPIVYSAGNTPRFHPLGFAKWGMLLWAGGEPVTAFCDAQISKFEKHGDTHEWHKNTKPILSYLRAFCPNSGVVLDFFCGKGSVQVGCKMLGRHYLAFEIIPEVAERARERVRNTQSPLFVLAPEQLEFDSEP